MQLRDMLIGLLVFLSMAAHAQQWESIIGTVTDVGDPGPHWFVVLGYDNSYLVDGDTGDVKGTLTLSMFSPAVRPHLEKGRIYSYGSFYTRTFYGDRTDVVLVFDARSTQPVQEIEIPPKSAGIGHSGMLGLIDGRFLGVWNITPAVSVSLVDVEQGAFLHEIATPGCAGIYPVGRGFLMPCGMGALQYVALDDAGNESGRGVSPTFFDVAKDPIYDYAVPTASGWLFVSLDGLVYEATVERGTVRVSKPWTLIDTADEKSAKWRIGGRQPFAYNAATGVLVTLMHEGGGQDTYRDAGTEVWAYDLTRQRRGYRLKLDEPAVSVQLTGDATPLLLVGSQKSEVLRIHDAVTGRKLREIPEMAGLIQPLMERVP